MLNFTVNIGGKIGQPNTYKHNSFYHAGFLICVQEITNKHSFCLEKKGLLTARLSNNLMKVIMSSQLLGQKSLSNGWKQQNFD